MDAIIVALKQESTWRGIIAIAMALGVALSPQQQEAILAAGLSLIGLINVFKKD